MGMKYCIVSILIHLLHISHTFLIISFDAPIFHNQEGSEWFWQSLPNFSNFKIVLKNLCY